MHSKHSHPSPRQLELFAEKTCQQTDFFAALELPSVSQGIVSVASTNAVPASSVKAASATCPTALVHPTAIEVASVLGIPLPDLMQLAAKKPEMIASKKNTQPVRLNVYFVYRAFLAVEGPHQVKPKVVQIEELTLTPDCQVRVALNDEMVATLEEHYRAEGAAGVEPIVVVKVGEQLLLVDGWHRVAAARRAGLRSIPAVILLGLFDWALAASRYMNNWLGTPLGTQDRRRALEIFVRYNLWLVDALVNQTIGLRPLAKATGFKKSALGDFAKSLVRAASCDASSAPSKVSVPGKSVADEGSDRGGDTQAEDQPLRDDQEVLNLLDLLRSTLATLPSDPADIRRGHRQSLTIIAGASLRLLAIHLGYRRFANAQDMRRVLRRHPCFQGLFETTDPAAKSAE